MATPSKRKKRFKPYVKETPALRFAKLADDEKKYLMNEYVLEKTLNQITRDFFKVFNKRITTTMISYGALSVGLAERDRSSFIRASVASSKLT